MPPAGAAAGGCRDAKLSTLNLRRRRCRQQPAAAEQPTRISRRARPPNHYLLKVQGLGVQEFGGLELQERVPQKRKCLQMQANPSKSKQMQTNTSKSQQMQASANTTMQIQRNPRKPMDIAMCRMRRGMCRMRRALGNLWKSVDAWKSMEIHGNRRKSTEIDGNRWKSMEIRRNR